MNSKILSVDYGDARTGLALSDPTGTLAFPAGVIHERNAADVAAQIIQIAIQNSAGTVILGLPKNMNNTLGERADKTLALYELLKKQFDGVVILRDERNTTKSAQRVLVETNTRGKKRKKVIDSLAASILLQDYLDSTIAERG